MVKDAKDISRQRGKKDNQVTDAKPTDKTIITLDYFLVITPVCIQLQYIKNDDIYHAETTTDDNMLETAYNMLLFVLKNILGREIK